MNLKEINPEVFVCDVPLVTVDDKTISFLIHRANTAPRFRVRLCAHQKNEDVLHEMIIVMTEKTYIRPHKHHNKSESMHIIDGVADIVRFDDIGEIKQLIPLGDYKSGHTFYYRVNDSHYHTLILRSPFLVVHETTNGPFNPTLTQFAPWAPEENDQARFDFMNQLKNLSIAKDSKNI